MYVYACLQRVRVLRAWVCACVHAITLCGCVWVHARSCHIHHMQLVDIMVDPPHTKHTNVMLKVIAINADDPKAKLVNDVADVEKEFPGEIEKITTWFRDYKVGHLITRGTLLQLVTEQVPTTWLVPSVMTLPCNHHMLPSHIPHLTRGADPRRQACQQLWL